MYIHMYMYIFVAGWLAHMQQCVCTYIPLYEHICIYIPMDSCYWTHAPLPGLFCSTKSLAVNLIQYHGFQSNLTRTTNGSK